MSNINILQIGCQDGNDEVFEFVKNNENSIEKIVLIDANEKSLQLAKNTYKNIKNVEFLNLAILPIDIDNKEINIYYPEIDETGETTSIFKDFVFKNNQEKNKNIKSFLVKTESMNKILEKYPETTHLYIDVEGLDALNIFSIKTENFQNIKELTFEYVHVDGFSEIEKNPKLNSLLIYLNSIGFTSYSSENLNIKLYK